MNSQMMSAIGELQKHRDEIQRLIRDLERIMAGMSKEDAPGIPAMAPIPVAKSNVRTAPVRREKARGGRPKSAEKDSAGLAMIQAIGQALTPMTPSEIMSATGLERWRVGQLLMEMTEQGSLEKTGYGSYRLRSRARPVVSDDIAAKGMETVHETPQVEHGLETQVP